MRVNLHKVLFFLMMEKYGCARKWRVGSLTKQWALWAFKDPATILPWLTNRMAQIVKVVQLPVISQGRMHMYPVDVS